MTMTNRRAGIISMTALGVAILSLLAIYAAGQTQCASAASGTCPAGLVRTISQGLTVNDDQADSDTVIKSVLAADTFYLDASTDRVGIGTSAPATLLHVDGVITGTSYQGIVGNLTPAAGTFTTLNATGGGALTGTWTNLGAVTTVDINGGTLDGTVIGGASAAAATVTTLNLTLGQITFPATQNPSAGANVLDDYEEGTWTPALGGSAGQSGQVAGANNAGRYVKIGRQVFVEGILSVSTRGTITGGAILMGLPFTANATVNASLNVTYYEAMGAPQIFIGGLGSNSTTYVNLYQADAAGTAMTSMVQADLANGSAILFNMTYTTQ